MTRAEYTLELELAPNTWSDLTGRWRIRTPLVIERGIAPGERVAGVGRLWLALHAPAGTLDGLAVGCGLRFSAAAGGATFPLFAGHVAVIRPRRGGMLELEAEDDIAALARVPVGAFPLLLEVMPGELVERLVSRGCVPPGRRSHWRLGHPVTALLGAGTRLSGADAGVNLDAGQSVFPWAGDTWPADRSVLAALRDVCASEGGWFFIAADGTPTFHDRHRRARHTDPDAELTGGLAGLEVTFSDAVLASRVEVTAYPREVGAAGSVLWSAGHSLRLRPGETRTLVCRYRDPDGMADVGALSAITPQAGADFTANTRADGSGEDVTEHIHIEMQAGASAAVLRLASTWPRHEAVYVHDLQIRGTPLRRYHPVVMQAVDEASLLAYGPRLLAVEMPLQADPAVAADMAAVLLTNRAEPHPWLTITLQGAAGDDLLAHGLAREVGDRIHLSSAAPGLETAACFIDGLRHEIRGGGASHRITWRTSSADLFAWWVLGQTAQAALGAGTRVGY